jgi:hypothetical protein
VHVQRAGDNVERADFEIGNLTVDHYVDRSGQIEFDVTDGSARC